MLAWFYRRLESDPRSFWRGFLPAVAAIGLVSVLIVKEDFGTGALVGSVAMLLCLIAGWRWWFPLLLVVPGIAGFYSPCGWCRSGMQRLKVWFDPWQYFNGAGWHVCQSLMGIGSGGLTGTGFGAGTQKLYIPENTTDFIFAVICEEMGLLGGLLVIGLFAVFIWRAGKVVQRAPDRFGFLLAAGIMLTVAVQAILNIGVVTGALPAKGISLPFISYGGSGLVMMSFAVGLLASVARRREVAGPPEGRAAAGHADRRRYGGATGGLSRQCSPGHCAGRAPGSGQQRTRSPDSCVRRAGESFWQAAAPGDTCTPAWPSPRPSGAWRRMRPSPSRPRAARSTARSSPGARTPSRRLMPGRSARCRGRGRACW